MRGLPLVFHTRWTGLWETSGASRRPTFRLTPRAAPRRRRRATPSRARQRLPRRLRPWPVRVAGAPRGAPRSPGPRGASPAPRLAALWTPPPRARPRTAAHRLGDHERAHLDLHVL